jgi:hypothetical protein
VKIDEWNSANRPFLAIGGVLQGQSSATERAYNSNSGYGSHETLQQCEKLALLALARPGRYTLAILRGETASSQGTYFVRSCRLARVN